MTEPLSPTYQITAPDLLTFALELEKAVLQGYRIDLTNDNCPLEIGFMRVATLVMPPAEVAMQELTQEAEDMGLYTMTNEIVADAPIEPVKAVKQGSGRPRKG